MAVAEDSEFWDRLARRINEARRATRDDTLRFLWLGGFVPGSLSPAPEHDGVLAQAFVSEDDGRSFVHYRVCLRLGGSAAAAYRKGEWRRLLPPPGSTGWLAIDRARKTIDIACA